VITVIIPTLDEEEALPAAIRSCREAGPCEVIVADGGSRDGTLDAARELADRWIVAPRGRAPQMNAGAGAACGEVLLFLHADTLLPPGGIPKLLSALRDSRVAGGAFRVSLVPSPGAGSYVRAMLALTGRMINLRSALTRSYTGDQAIFLRADVPGTGRVPRDPPDGGRGAVEGDAEAGEDRPPAGPGQDVRAPLGSVGPPSDGPRMWRLRLGYLLGMSPERCAEVYRRAPFPLTRRPGRAPRSAGGE